MDGTQESTFEWRNLIICRKEAKVCGTHDVRRTNFQPSAIIGRVIEFKVYHDWGKIKLSRIWPPPICHWAPSPVAHIDPFRQKKSYVCPKISYILLPRTQTTDLYNDETNTCTWRTFTNCGEDFPVRRDLDRVMGSGLPSSVWRFNIQDGDKFENLTDCREMIYLSRVKIFYVRRKHCDFTILLP